MHSYIHSNLGATWRLVVSFTPRPTLPARKNQLNRRLHGPHSRAGRFTEDRNHLFLTGFEPRAVQSAAYSLYRLRQNLTQNYKSSGLDLNQLRHAHNTTLLKKTQNNEHCAVQYTKPKKKPLHQMGLRSCAPRLQLDVVTNRKILDSSWNKISAGQPTASSLLKQPDSFCSTTVPPLSKSSFVSIIERPGAVIYYHSTNGQSQTKKGCPPAWGQADS